MQVLQIPVIEPYIEPRAKSNSNMKQGDNPAGKLFGRFLFGLQFLTIIPLPGRLCAKTAIDTSEIGRSSAIFPMVGLVIGIFLAISWMIMAKLLPTGVASIVSVVLLAAITGGLHLDGLSDTIDAIAARKPVEQKIAIMKSGTAGPIGSAAVTLTMILKCQLLYSISSSGIMPMTIALVTFPAVARSACVFAMYCGKSINKSGLGNIFIGNIRLVDLIVSSIITAILLSISGTLNIWLPAGFATKFCIDVLSPNFARFALALPLVYTFTYGAVMFFKKHLGGINGDILGAFIETNELLYLTLLTVRFSPL